MRSFITLVLLASLGFTATLSFLNWRIQKQTQQSLTELAAALNEQKTAPAQPLALQPHTVLPPVASEVAANPAAVSSRVYPANWNLEAPDLVKIEVSAEEAISHSIAHQRARLVDGTFVIHPDGSVNLGKWGKFTITGMTVEKATQAIREHLALILNFSQPESVSRTLEVKMEVVAFNSKRAYVIVPAKSGQSVMVLPLTGSETLLDLLKLPGMRDAVEKSTIELARHQSNEGQAWQVLPVNWEQITQKGITLTNYQLMPGDRIYLKKAAKG